MTLFHFIRASWRDGLADDAWQVFAGLMALAVFLFGLVPNLPAIVGSVL